MKRSLLALALAAACAPGDEAPHFETGENLYRWPVGGSPQMDFLFVIDNSPAMAPHAERLARNLETFIDAVRVPPTGDDVRLGRPDVRVAITTTDLGDVGCASNDDGRFHGTTDMTGDFLVDFVGDDAMRQRNYDGDIRDVFLRMASVGSSGCEHVQPLAAARRALERHPVFLRDAAFTWVVIISANDAPDDAASLETYVQFFRSIERDPHHLGFVGVLGAPQPDARIPSLFSRFPGFAVVASMLDDDWSEALTNFRLLFKTDLAGRCFWGPLLDIDPVTSGLQAECTAWYEFPFGGEVIPPCTASPSTQCWRMVEDPRQCDPETVTRMTYAIDRPRMDFPRGTWLFFNCRTR